MNHHPLPLDEESAVRGARFCDGGAAVNDGDALPLDAPVATPETACAAVLWALLAAAALALAIGAALAYLPAKS